ncbi:hypothetical protein dsx2_1524 [Desulfovibrio sp. X2]|uniref:hypothetical protein n=1 Tax=Desulfovibrio sp. X2 TaxID=941449 RepID=UPI000358B9CE|nr:hypothetical protein [Desulfovibrio sp. X2]EPR44565.1 hypothetical protein dsx2_1524 [Desulfovibrio sp. X2]
MDPITIIAGLASVVPTIAKWLTGEKSDVSRVAETAAELAKRVTGASDPAAAIAALKADRQQALEFEKLWAGVNMGLSEQLTRRHEADMKSDSWLAKNVRPLCLVGLTLGVVVAVFAPEVAGDKLRALTEMGGWVYGYYFIGRSAFDKGAVRLNFGANAGRAS